MDSRRRRWAENLLAGGGGRALGGEGAVGLRAVPGFYLLIVVDLGEKEDAVALGTSLDKGTRIVELALHSIQVADGVAEDARAVGPPAGMEGANLVGFLVEHLVIHRDMVQIAEWSELRRGRHGLVLERLRQGRSGEVRSG